ncbi:MAG: hypothetical protein MMC33_001136 [Icmadophila ericetorum]|nr:hypothetical protein [Icmadophila ericetorum]
MSDIPEPPLSLRVKFKALEAKMGTMSFSEVQEFLKTPPSVSEVEFGAWLIPFQAAKTRELLLADPLPQDEYAEKLLDLDFNDPDSINHFFRKFPALRLIGFLHLGNVSNEGKAFSYSIHIDYGALPEDFEPDEGHVETELTQIRCSSKDGTLMNTDLPDFVL